MFEWLRELSERSWAGLISILLIILDFYARVSTNNWTQAIYYDAFLGLAMGYWFGKKQGSGKA